MKKAFRGILALSVAALLILLFEFSSTGNHLKASEDDGTVTATEQQETHEEPKVESIQITPSEATAPAEQPAEAQPETEPETEAAVESEAEETETVSTEEEAQEEPSAETDAEEELPSESFNSTAKIKMENKGAIHMGDTIRLYAEVSNVDTAYTVRWQYSDGEKWYDIIGENGTTYDFVVDEVNAGYTYRVVIDY